MISQVVPGLLCLMLLLAFLGMGLWVPFALIAVSVVALAAFTDVPIGEAIASSMWAASSEWALASLPMFIWMGEILYRSRFSDDLFDGLSPWIGWLPGRLVHINILGSGIFAAVSGSSAATCATIGKMSVPELRRRGYDDRLIIGTLAGSATLGFLIPPSIILIVYGVAAEESIARLFVAGILPGLLMIALFMSYVAAWSALHRDRVPPGEPSLPFLARARTSVRLAPVIALVVCVVGAIYTGLASPTDAAAVGVAFSLLLTWWAGDLTRRSLVESLLAATRTACMIGFILTAAAFLSSTMGFTGIPRLLATSIGDLGLEANVLLLILTVFFIVLGCFLDGISIIILTTSIILPIVEAAGIDLIWFGVYLVLVVEMSQIPEFQCEVQHPSTGVIPVG